MSSSTFLSLDAGKPQDNDNLTDNEIQQLLLEAEARMRIAGSTIGETDFAASKGSKPALSGILRLESCRTLQPYVHQRDDIAAMDTSRIINPTHKGMVNVLHRAVGVTSKSPKNKKDKQTAGSDWFDLPKTDLTPELRRDLQLLRMRSVLDPKRHYKKENGKAKLPEFSQVGTVIQGPTEFFSARIAKKDRKGTFVGEAMAFEQDSGRFQAKYRDIQTAKMSGKKSYYKNLLAKRQRGKSG